MDVKIKPGIQKPNDQLEDLKKQQADLTFQLMMAGVI
jgi:ribosomal protein L29